MNFNSLIVQLIKIKQFVIVCNLMVLLFLLGACVAPDENTKEDDRQIAKVFNKSLFQSELNDLVGDEVSPEDSALIINAYIEKWVRSAVVMHEAEKYVPKDLNIDELVRDYRASLIRHNYEKILVEMNLDSTISQQELDTFYQENKEQYKLKNPLLKCHFIKIPKPAEGWDDVERWWKSEDIEDYKKLVDYSSRYAEVYMLSDSIWYSLADVSVHLPKGKLTPSNYSSSKKISTDDEGYRYLLKVFETLAPNQYAPLSFIQDKAKKVILHKRKIQLLDEKKEEMYERETQNNNIFIKY